jgi:hypothetical protein
LYKSPYVQLYIFYVCLSTKLFSWGLHSNLGLFFTVAVLIIYAVIWFFYS